MTVGSMTSPQGRVLQELIEDEVQCHAEVIQAKLMTQYTHTPALAIRQQPHKYLRGARATEICCFRARGRRLFGLSGTSDQRGAGAVRYND